MKTMLLIFVGLFMPVVLAWAHPGELDGCLGHTVTERVEYPPNPTGEPTYPSEPGEYHYHFSYEQMDNEVIPSLSEYRREHPASTSLGIDYGSFVVGGNVYDIWEHTRDENVVIIHCRDDEDVLHTGVARIK